MSSYQQLFDQQVAYFQHHNKQSGHSERIAKLKKLKAWIKAHEEHITQAVFQDFAKPPFETRLTELLLVIKEINLALSHLDEWMRDKKYNSPVYLLGAKSWVSPEPKGVSLIITPWNFPFMLSINPLVSAIAAGNCVILKPSELTPNCSAMLAEMISELFDPAEISVLQGGPDLSTELLSLPFHHIYFTGSPKVGKIVMQAAARNLSSITLELGGQNPAIVHESARLKTTVRRLIWSKCMNSAQSCVAPNYVFVQRSIYPDFISEMKRQLNKFQSATEQAYKTAGIVNQKHFNRIRNLLEESLNSGASALNEKVVDEEARRISPLFLQDVKPDNPVMQQEIFGPLLPVLVFDSGEELINLINAKERALALYIFARNKRFIQSILKQTSSGSVMINDTTLQFANNTLPFGGLNYSGIGKSHGYHGFLAFTNLRTVMKQHSRFSLISLLYPPYSRMKFKLLSFITWKI